MYVHRSIPISDVRVTVEHSMPTLLVFLQSEFSLYGWSPTCKLQVMKRTEALSTNLDRKNHQSMWRRMADWWCTQMHDSCMWPIHGEYRCATCGRRQPIPWAQIDFPITIPPTAYQAARRFTLPRTFKRGASFFFALKTRHCTVPIGIALAAAIS
jgi:hypothetical protein